MTMMLDTRLATGMHRLHPNLHTRTVHHYQDIRLKHNKNNDGSTVILSNDENDNISVDDGGHVGGSRSNGCKV